MRNETEEAEVAVAEVSRPAGRGYENLPASCLAHQVRWNHGQLLKIKGWFCVSNAVRGGRLMRAGRKGSKKFYSEIDGRNFARCMRRSTSRSLRVVAGLGQSRQLTTRNAQNSSLRVARLSAIDGRCHEHGSEPGDAVGGGRFTPLEIGTG